MLKVVTEGDSLMLKVVTECPDHGFKVVESGVAILATPDGRLFTFTVDPHSKGLLVSAGGHTLSVGLVDEDGKVRPDALVLSAPPVTAADPDAVAS